MKKNKINRYLKNIGKILISVILLYFVFQKIPFREVTKLWSNINFIYLLIASLLFLASQIISTKRLELFFKANNFHLSFYSNLKLYFIGMFYNFFIPGGIGGDAFKVYILNKNFDWNAKKITSSLFNDRLSGLLAICTLILAISFNLFEIKYFPIIIVLEVIGIFFTYFLTKKMFSSYRFIFFKAFFYSILVQVLQVICFIFILLSFNVTNNFSIYSVIFLASSILSLISFAGIGIREMLFLQASKWFGFQSEIAVSASLLFTMITAFFSLFGVIFQIRKLNLKLTETP